MIRVSQLRLVAGDVAARRRTGDGFARRTGLVAAGQAAVKATQVVLSIALVRLLGPADWNATAFLLSIYLAGTTIGTLNMQHGLVFFLPRMHPEQRSSLVLRTMAVLLGMGALIWLALTAAAPALSGGRLSDSSTVIWIGAAIALELPSACVPMAMIATDRFGRAAIWDLAGTVLILVATIVPAASGAGTAGVVAGLVAVGAIRLVAGVWFVDRTLTEDTSTTTTSDGRRPVARHVLARQLVYSIPLGVAVAVAMLNRLVDKWFIAAFRSGDFGTYAVAAQEVPLLAVLPYAGGAAIVTSLVAAFRDDDLALARTHWLHLTVTMSAVVVPMARAREAYATRWAALLAQTGPQPGAPMGLVDFAWPCAAMPLDTAGSASRGDGAELFTPDRVAEMVLLPGISSAERRRALQSEVRRWHPDLG